MGDVIAAFDVDGTLTVRDCVVPFLALVAGGHHRLAARLARRPLELARIGVARDRDRAKAAAAQAVFGGQRADRVQDEGRAFAGIIGASWLRPDTRGRLDWHREQGHAVVLVSASFEAYLVPLGADLGVSGVVGTRLTVDPAGRCTGALDGANCRGDEKVARLRAWQSAHGLEGALLWAYGDSAGDDAMLAVADHPTRVTGVAIARSPVRA